jgi:putative nucleotidyltransferase with HDIG domain
MNREKALDLVKKNLKNKNLVSHSLAMEAVMRAYAEFLGEDSDIWALAGLVHDLDYEETAETPLEHGLKGEKILLENGFSREIIEIAKAHNGMLELPLDSKAKIIIQAADPLTGLIVASALIHPDKKLSSIDAKFVLNRFSKKDFARGARREDIKKCENADINLETFIEIGLKAMQNISKEIGL